MRLIYRRALALLCTIFFLSSCSLFDRDGWLRDRGDDYLGAKEIPPMQVPEELDDSSISEMFVIPPIENEYVDTEEDLKKANEFIKKL